jgi:transmembrane sensor
VSTASRWGALWVCAGFVSCALAGAQAVQDGDTYETAIGDSQCFTLRDGATVQLNTDTRVMAFRARRGPTVKLSRGEAFFQVNPTPLEVTVNDWLVSGSRSTFDVRDYGGERFEVMVLDGSVLLSPPVAGNPGRTAAAHRAVWVSAGQLALVSSGITRISTPGRPAIQRKLAWRDHRLEFMNETVGAVVEEFNRYGRTQLSIPDAALSAQRIGGVFAPDDATGFAASVSKLFEVTLKIYQTPSGPVIQLTPAARIAGNAP